MTIAPLCILVPIAGATALALASPFTSRRVGGGPALACAVATLALCVALLGQASDGVVVWLGNWRPVGDVAIGIALAVDPLGAGFAVFSAALGVTALMLAARLIVVDDLLFDALALVFLAAMIGFCLSGDLFNLFVFLELMGVCAYALVGYEIGQRAPLEGSLTFAVTNTMGGILLLFGIGLLYGETGALNLADMGRALAGHEPDALLLVAFALVTAGFLVKAAAVPFHLWTADAYAVAPTPICILLAGAFAELGLYGFARVYWAVFDPALHPQLAELRAILVAVGAITAVVGAVMCATQHHLKRMLAFATIAHVGLFLIGLALLTPDGVAGVALWVVGDGLARAALFACAGILQHRYDAVEEVALHGRARGMWPVGVLMGLAALAVAALPPFGPFFGRAVVEDAALALGYDWVPLLMLVVAALVAGTLLRATLRIFAGWGRPAPSEAGEEQETEREAGDLPAATSPLLWVPAAALVAAALVWGLAPGLLDDAGRAAAAFVDGAGYREAVLAGAALQPPPLELHGPGVTAYLYAAGSLVGAAVVALLPLRRVPPAPAVGRRLLRGLRALHSGHVGDYAAWTVVGTAALAASFTLILG